MKKVLSFSAGILLLFAGCSKENLDEDSQVQGNRLKGYSSGTDHGYFYSLYVSGGSASISFPSAGTYAGNFAISYSSVDDVVGGKGWSTGAARTINYNVGSLSGSYNMIGVYGWTTSPLIEYYVAEFGSMASGTYVGTLTSDGHTYSVYKHQQVNQPSITGTATFWQYLDTWGGSSTGSNHAITMSNHINNWKSNAGQGFGSYNYQIFALEAWGSKSGYINATVW
jgi:endo-1,4-beta-xylanase